MRLVMAALLLLLLVGCSLRPTSSRYSRYLQDSWVAYQGSYLQPEGYVLDRERDGGTVTSEGQSYALLRALWIRDEAAFERVYRWTETNLARDDGLYSWLWTPSEGGRILDANTASDGDQDIAFALILAAHAFDRPAYRDRAREIIISIRRHAAIETPQGWYPAAGNWAVSDRVANLSYFAPYAYEYFDRLDPDGRWLEVLASGYDLIQQQLEVPESVLIPDFIRIERDGKVGPLPPGTKHSADFSFDAVRVHWRVAVDCQLHARPVACSDVAGTRTLAGLLHRDGRLVTRYRLDGLPLTDGESFSFYGAVLPAFRLHSPAAADQIIETRLNIPTLSGLALLPDHYYDLNWVWFGIAADVGWIRDRTPSPEEAVAS